MNRLGDGPLRKIGPAARWCLVAGVLSNEGPPPPVEDFAREAGVIVEEGLSSVADRALIGHAAHVGQPYLDIFRHAALVAQMKSMAAEVVGAQVLAGLSSSGISTAIVKGPSMAQYHPPGWPRPFVDIDLLVSINDFPRAISLAEDAGFEHSERSVPQWSWFDSLCREGINLHSRSGGNIDFHHHLPPWAIGSSVNVADVINRSEPHRLCGASTNFAPATDQILVAALHILNDLWKGKMGLASWRDFVVLAKFLGETDVHSSFDRARLRWLYELIARELHRRVPEAQVRPTGMRVTLPLMSELRLTAFGWSRESITTRHRLAWAARLPAWNALAFLAGTAVPSPTYVHTRHGTFKNYWISGWKETVLTAKGSDYRMTTVDDYKETLTK